MVTQCRGQPRSYWWPVIASDDKVRSNLLILRQLIFDTAAVTEGVGELEETLRWGEPSDADCYSLRRNHWSNRESTSYAVRQSRRDAELQENSCRRLKIHIRVLFVQ